jgi:hypothetical protein
VIENILLNVENLLQPKLSTSGSTGKTQRKLAENQQAIILDVWELK